MSNGVNYSRSTWDQLKGLTAKNLISALENDPNWELNRVQKNKYVFYNPARPPAHQEIVIHYHPSKGGYRNRSLLKYLLDSINWTEQDLKDLKLIK